MCSSIGRTRTSNQEGFTLCLVGPEAIFCYELFPYSQILNSHHPFQIRDSLEMTNRMCIAFHLDSQYKVAVTRQETSAGSLCNREVPIKDSTHFVNHKICQLWPRLLWANAFRVFLEKSFFLFFGYFTLIILMFKPFSNYKPKMPIMYKNLAIHFGLNRYMANIIYAILSQ